MKKGLLFLFALTSISCISFAQSSFPDIELKKRLRNFLVEKKFAYASDNSIAHEFSNFGIYNLVTFENVMIKHDSSDYGIYGFRESLGHDPVQVFLKNKDEIVILEQSVFLNKALLPVISDNFLAVDSVYPFNIFLYSTEVFPVT